LKSESVSSKVSIDQTIFYKKWHNLDKSVPKGSQTSPAIKRFQNN
jgi:hypothetical protein